MKYRVLFIAMCLIPVLAMFSYCGLQADNSVKSNIKWNSMVNEKSAPQVIYKLVDEMQKELEKNSDRFPELMKEMENYTSQVKDPAVKAFFHSLIAEMYSTYYQNNEWTIRQRTQLADFIPEDIREWSANLFVDKIGQEVKSSLEPAESLQQTSVESYKKIMDLRTDSRELRPTLYDFLLDRAIRLDDRNAETYYQQWIAFRKTQPNKKAALMVILAYLEESLQIGTPSKNLAYQQALDSLSLEYTDKECRLELALAKLKLLQSGSNVGYYRNLPDGKEKERLSTIHAFVSQCVADFGKTGRASQFYRVQTDMENPYVSVRTDNNVYPGKNLALKLTYRNLPHVKVSIYKNREYPESVMHQSKPKLGELVSTTNVQLPVAEPFLAKDTIVEIPVEKSGLYYYKVEGDDKISVSGTFSVSRLAAIVRPTNDKRSEVLVTDYHSGKPIAEAIVICYGGYNRSYVPELVGKVVTDKQGIAKIDFGDPYKVRSVRPLMEGDTASLPTYVRTSYRSEREKQIAAVSIFTDRAIYRPGQTVCFKGILYADDEKQTFVKAGEEYSVSLRDANNKEVVRKTFKTNEFGSFQGEFTLPTSSLTGTYSLSSAFGNRSFRVEEYKRPTYEVSVDRVKEIVSFGEKMALTGKAVAYSGVPLSSGKAKWSIRTAPVWWARYYMPLDWDNRLEASGVAEVREDGTFQIDFVPVRQESDKPCVVLNYQLEVILTDSKGETQETSITFAVGDTRMLLSVDVASQMEKEKSKVVVTAMTLNGEKIKAKGEYKLYTLKPKGGKTRVEREQYETGEMVLSGSFVSEQPINKERFASLPSNRYRLVVSGKDDRGNLTEAERDFVLYSMKDQRPPIETDCWMPQSHLELAPGETGNLLFGTTHEAIYLLYELFSQEGKVLRREVVRMGKANRSFPVRFEEAYGDGVTLSFTYILDGRLIAEEATVTRKQPDRKLTIIPTTFRDHLLPGSMETWKFRLVQPDSTAAKAEVLAGMYDLSLDAIASHYWRFYPAHHYSLWTERFHAGQTFDSSNGSSSKRRESIPSYSYHYDNLYGAWFDMLSWSSPWKKEYVMQESRPMMRSASVNMKALSDDGFVEESAEGASLLLADEEVSVAEDKAEASSALEGKPAESASLRKDFAETAFFYPLLKTDDKGEVSFDFTLPESNTTWKLQLLAHTEGLKYGYWSKEVVSSKPIMVQPNLPRFLREGDQMTLSAQLSNQSGKEIKGKVALELLVPEDESILYRAEKLFTSASNNTETVHWVVPVAEWSRYGVLGCRIVATTSEGNDGEQHLLPILSKQIMVTESIPFYLMDEKEKSIQLPSQAVENPYRVTLELTANPVWYAVQALATLDIIENEDLVSLLAVYYSNSLSQHIAQSHPRIKKIVDKWKAEGSNSETLLSNLEKNSELKSVLLEETPWVMEAKNETEQKQRLQLLFDINRAGNLKREVLEKLQKRQLDDGGWGWMPGMRSSLYMTIQVLDAMARLVDLQAVEYGETEKLMQMKALAYVDRTIQKEYELDVALRGSDYTPSESELYALLVRSCYRDVPEAGNSHEAYKYYADRAAARWKEYGLSGRAMVAKLMWKNGNRKLAKTILDWFKQTATVDSEMGMYWANNRPHFAGSMMPLETHCLIMSLFADMQTDIRQMNQMKQWLIGQKRTQNWESAGASIDAIYALLLAGDSWIEKDNSCQVTWNGNSWRSDEGETATGYLKVSLSNDQLKQSQQRQVRIRKEGDALAWGAVYTQYFAPLSSIEKDKGVMNVEKKLFIEKKEGSERQMVQVTENQSLHVGDRAVVRLTIRSDRAMDYVFLKDLRSACMEPVNQLSRTECREGIWYYQAARDLSENIYIEHLPEGTFVLEYPVYISRTGKYTGGISTIQCLYAPEFISRTEGMVIEVCQN